MPFYFIHPLYLVGLITAIGPLLIHLINRRKRIKVRFPAVRFVLLSQRRITRSYHLRHWFLLALRTLLVLLIVLLLAQPVFQSGIGLFSGNGPVSTVIVLDNSLSMNWSRKLKGFGKAKKAVNTLISALQKEDRVVLIPTNGFPMHNIRFSKDREAAIRELEKIKITAGMADFSNALAMAHEFLKEPAAQKIIWLVTDMTLTSWDQFALSSLGRYDPMIPLKIINVRNEKKRFNATIRTTKIRSQRIAVGLPIHLDAIITNFSEESIKGIPVLLNLNDREEDQKLVDLPSKGTTVVSFQFKLERPGSSYGHIQLKKADIAGNSKVHFTLQAQEKLRVLVVDGDPKTSLIQSETFFLTRALNPTGKMQSSFFLPTVIVPEALQNTSLEPYEVIILCNVENIPARVLPKITEHLQRGKGLLLFLGNQIDRRDYNYKLLKTNLPILPGEIGDQKVVIKSKGEKIAKIQFSHPALEGLTDSILNTSIKSARVHGFYSVAAPSGSTLISLTNGIPLLIEKKIGLGKVLLVTTAADLDWSDLPIKTTYLPLIQSLVFYLSSNKRGSVDTGLTAGTTKIISLPPSYVGKSLKISNPDRKEKDVTFIAAGEKALASFEENDLAGIYRFIQTSSQGGQLRKNIPHLPIYAVNPPYLESKLQEVSSVELRNKLQPMKLEIIPLDSLEKGGIKVDLSLPLLLVTILVIALEGWLTQKIHE